MNVTPMNIIGVNQTLESKDMNIEQVGIMLQHHLPITGNVSNDAHVISPYVHYMGFGQNFL